MEHKSRSKTEPAGADFSLPVTVVTKTDMLRLGRELKAVENFLQQAAIRRTSPSDLPRASALLQKLASENASNLLEHEGVVRMLKNIQKLEKEAPIVHISFAVDPSTKFLESMVGWFRKEVHPHVLLQIGLQPSIAGGCIIRTRNKYFDLSLRKHLREYNATLLEKIRETESA